MDKKHALRLTTKLEHVALVRYLNVSKDSSMLKLILYSLMGSAVIVPIGYFIDGYIVEKTDFHIMAAPGQILFTFLQVVLVFVSKEGNWSILPNRLEIGLNLLLYALGIFVLMKILARRNSPLLQSRTLP